MFMNKKALFIVIACSAACLHSVYVVCKLLFRHRNNSQLKKALILQANEAACLTGLHFSLMTNGR